MSAIADNIKVIDQQIRAAAERAGRDRSEITLISVSKAIEPDLVEAALQAGQTIFGESKVQEARAKIPIVSSRARWHLIGHLQSNKARDAVALFDVIHSVDSLRLAEDVNKWSERSGQDASHSAGGQRLGRSQQVWLEAGKIWSPP